MEWKDIQKEELLTREERLDKRNLDTITIQQGEDTPVVTNRYDNFYDPNIFSRWFRQFCVDNGFGTMGKVIHYVDDKGMLRTKRSGYKGLMLHQLRHTQATLLIGNGADIKTVQSRLGHSTAALTMDIYSHAIEQNDEAAAEEIGGLLSRGN